MPILIPYLVKLFVSLTIVLLFYQLVLRKLTFYNANRWYLVVFTALSFLVPFINVTTFVNGNPSADGLMQFIPAVQTYSVELEDATHCPIPLWSTSWNKWDWLLFSFAIGTGILFIRFLVRCFSFLRLRRMATLLPGSGLNIYHVDAAIIPFSFGNSIFINSNQHTETELREIIRHEFIHVKQNHTIDILWAELMCMLNWYNPAAWLLRSSIRQNLEFIADNKVLENGVDRKQYQYLLLKVIGNDQFSIAQKFNFSSLKKRIAMMNKTRSGRIHLLRFLLVLPVLAVILVSFRDQITDTIPDPPKIVRDTIPDNTKPNEKGYIINIKDNNGNCIVVVQDRQGKVVEKLPLTKWNDNPSMYTEKYGDIPPPPPPKAPKAPTPPRLIPPAKSVQPLTPPDPPAPPERKDGSTTIIGNSDGPMASAGTGLGQTSVLSPSTVTMGSLGKGSLTRPVTIAGRTGQAVMATTAGITSNGTGQAELATTVGEFPFGIGQTQMASPIRIGSTVSGQTGTGTLAPIKNGQATIKGRNPINNVEDILTITISKFSNREQLEQYKKQLKEAGVELEYDKMEYNAQGALVHLSGTLKSKEGRSNFVGKDFQRIVLRVTKKDGRTSFNILTSNSREVI
jgi:hypothetical protein